MRFRPFKFARLPQRGDQSAKATCVADLAVGGRGRVVATTGTAEEQNYLHGLGITPGVEVRVCRAGSPCVLGVDFPCGGVCRIGIGRDIARRIYVDCTCGKTGTDVSRC